MFLKKIIFNFWMGYFNYIIKRNSDNLYAYPLIVSMEFEKDWYWKQYLKGISIKKSMLKKLRIIERKYLRALKPISPELEYRYNRWREYLNRIQEKAELYKLHPELLTDPDLKDIIL